jgi:isopentenyl phosphate kinase
MMFYAINKEEKESLQDLLEAQENEEKEPKHLILVHGVGSLAHSATYSAIALRLWRTTPHCCQTQVQRPQILAQGAAYLAHGASS